MAPRLSTPVTEFVARVVQNVETVILGKRRQIEYLLVAVLCRGHVLIEDVPGTGKTMLARAMAASLKLDFKRLQCTPDLLPNDVTGVNLYNQQTGNFEFRPGPAMVNVLLADEINRATPRAQSALLEAMQERQVSADGITHVLPEPFLVMATQNPVEFEGTFPLPEAQLDRFLLKLPLGYPAEEEEIQMLRNLRKSHPIDHVEPVAEPDELADLSERVSEVHVDDSVERYILRTITATRKHSDLMIGASPRGSLGLYKTAQALAAIRGRDFVLPDDVKEMTPAVLGHRIILKPETPLRGRDSQAVLTEIAEQTELDIGDEVG
jgi:MoxR-like ATPase